MQILAIDPGLSGAVVRFSGVSGMIEAKRDFKRLADLSCAITELSPGCAFCVLELVASRTAQGVKSIFSFGRATGVAFGTLYTTHLRDKIYEIPPQVWKRFWRTMADVQTPEVDSRAVVAQVFPQHSELVRRAKDHNTADAILLAAYGAHAHEMGELRTHRVVDAEKF